MASSPRHAPTGQYSSGGASRRPLLVVLLGLLAVAVVAGVVYLLTLPGAGAAYAIGDPGPKVTAEPDVDWYEPATKGPVSFTLVAVGDVLPHGQVNSSARSGSGYDYTKLFSQMRPWIEGADLAICHMEVPVAPPGSSPSGYPVFGAPKELVRDLKKVGWDGCSTASNHSVDRGWDGVKATLDEFEKQHLGAAGTARSKAESDSAQFYYVRSGGRYIKVAHISYAYGLNGLPKPSGKPWAVNTYNAGTPNMDPVIKDAKQARADGADVVIVSLHCCVEYITAPGSAQKKAAQDLADSGVVDLVIGHHAHVPQPIAKLDGGPYGEGMWVAYGLGNFVSNQSSQCCVAETSNGIMLVATFTVDLDGTVHVDAEWAGTTVDRAAGHRVYMLTEVKNGKGNLSKSEIASRYRLVKNAAGKVAKERTTPPTKLADAVWMVPRGSYLPQGESTDDAAAAEASASPGTG